MLLNMEPHNSKGLQRHTGAKGFTIKTGWPHFRELEPVRGMAAAVGAGQEKSASMIFPELIHI